MTPAALPLRAALAPVCLALLAGCGPMAGTGSPPALHAARLAAAIEDVVLIPPSAAEPPRARLNLALPAPDGSHRLFVADMTGPVWIVRDGAVGRAPFVDLATARKGRFTSGNLFEQGLASFAFHPDYASPGRPGFGRFYTFGTELQDPASAPSFAPPARLTASAHHDVVLEWRVDAADPDRIDPASAREVLRIVHPRHDHVGGLIAFDPNARPGDAGHGKLYIGVGDGGNTVLVDKQVDTWRTAQDKASPLGKILRIDPLADGTRPYRVPDDNPLRADPSALPEIWALGLRNPQRFGWDSAGSHTMLIADIGQNQLEEIDIGRAGANYGWSEREGPRMVKHADQAYRLGRPLLDAFSGYSAPALAYGHHLGLAVTGIVVYRGSALPQLQGMAVFGDTASGRIFFADVRALADGGQAPFYELPLHHRGRPATLRQIVGGDRADLRFGVDERGELLILTKQDGMVRRLSALVPAETSIWPVEDPLDPLPLAWWQHLARDLEATARAFLRWP